MSKDVTSGYKYRGDFKVLVDAVRKAAKKMNLNIGSSRVTDRSLSFKATEKMNWLSTNWPVRFSIEAEEKDGDSILIVRAGSTLTSITQEHSNQAKVREFVELTKLYAPTSTTETHTAKDIGRVPCPRCGEMIAKTAKICRYCRTEFPETVS